MRRQVFGRELLVAVDHRLDDLVVLRTDMAPQSVAQTLGHLPGGGPKFLDQCRHHADEQLNDTVPAQFAQQEMEALARLSQIVFRSQLESHLLPEPLENGIVHCLHHPMQRIGFQREARLEELRLSRSLLREVQGHDVLDHARMRFGDHEPTADTSLGFGEHVALQNGHGLTHDSAARLETFHQIGFGADHRARCEVAVDDVEFDRSGDGFCQSTLEDPTPGHTHCAATIASSPACIRARIDVATQGRPDAAPHSEPEVESRQDNESSLLPGSWLDVPRIFLMIFDRTRRSDQMYERNLQSEFDGPQRVVEVLKRGVELFGDTEMIVTPTGRLTYAEVDDLSRRLAKRFLATGLGKGSRVAAHLPNGTEWIVAFFAATRIGALFMPFSAAYKPAELRKSLLLGDVHLLIASTDCWHGGPYQEFFEEAAPEAAGVDQTPLRLTSLPYLREVWLTGRGPLPTWASGVDIPALDDVTAVPDALLDALEEQVVPADDALVIWTSGSTAEPKGAIHSQATIGRRAKANQYSHGFVHEDRVFCDFAFWWVGGPGYGFLPTFWAGGTVLAVPRRDEDTQAFIDAEAPTRMAGFAQTLELAPGGSSRAMTPPGIGMTETFGPHSMNGPMTIEQYTSSPTVGLGPCILGFERKLIDSDRAEVADGEIGELLVRGPLMMSGLYRRERDEVFDSDGWYHTGDRCYVEDGSLHFVSRLNEMIKTSGSNVAPLEVEFALVSAAGVQSAAVFGMPDCERGQAVVAVVTSIPGTPVDSIAVQDHVRTQLSNYKVPRRVIVMVDDDAPRLHSGKLDKRALKQHVESLDKMAQSPTR